MIEPTQLTRFMEELRAPTEQRRLSVSLDEVIARRVNFLIDYQDARYSTRYSRLVEKVRQAEARAVPGSKILTDAVARSLFKLMAYKDEYEMGRLYSDGRFAKQIATAFEGTNLRLEFHLAPPCCRRKIQPAERLAK